MSDDKTEPPSPKKLRQAREEGNVPRSRDFGQAIVFGVACVVLGKTAAAGAARVRHFAEGCFRTSSEHADRLPALCMEAARQGVQLTLTTIAPLLGACFIVALASGFVQTGGLFSVKALQPKFSKLNPAAGLKNLFFSGKTYVELLKNLVKLTVAAILGWKVVAGAIHDIMLTATLPITDALALTETLVGSVLKQVGGFMFAVGGADLLYQRHTWYKGLMMSKQEIKDEYKQSEGDPHTKHQRKKMAKEIANQKGVKDVKQAKVVVTNPHEIAVALEYDPETMGAPQVLCKGERLIAQQIIEAAREAGVPIMQNIPLAHSLSELESGDEVPEDLYEAVAEVLNWVYAMALEEGQAAEGTESA
jgi:flagellar biosynthetic protein FlhB